MAIFIAKVKLIFTEIIARTDRGGGATVCAISGISDRLFKRQGRWKSESAKGGYIKDMLDSKLLVSLIILDCSYLYLSFNLYRDVTQCKK